MGHEFLGTVLEVGSAVTGIARGDRVVSPFTTSCGACFYCTHQLPARCDGASSFGWVERGIGLHGGQAEIVRVPLADSTLVRLPEDLAPESGLVLGDVLATGYHCAVLARVEPGTIAAGRRLWTGGIDGVLAARELGAARVFAIDSVPERLALAARYGRGTGAIG
jgi:threonine dehydrogenase-like Zn-dependent dehydrogenase